MAVISIVTAPTVTPATLDEVKAHLRIDDAAAEEDTYIVGLIHAATTAIESHTGRALIDRTVDVLMDAYELTSSITLPLAPVSAIVSVTAETDAGDVTAPPTDYRLRSFRGATARRPILELLPGKSWPSPRGGVRYPVAVQVTAGYGPASTDVPDGLRQALYVMVGGWYESRQDWTQGGPPGQYGPNGLSLALLEPYRLLVL